MNGLKALAKYIFELSSENSALQNSYDFWVYPNEKTTTFPKEVRVCTVWNETAMNALRKGKTVLLLPQRGTLKGSLPSCFTTYYWTSFGEKGGQSSACGILADTPNAMFNDFPSETHANWQWWELLTQGQPMILDPFEEKHPWPKSYRPLIQAIDSWKLNRKLGLVVEAKLGKGKLLICSMYIEHDLMHRPVARQFRKSLVAYLQSENFNPQTEVNNEVVSALFDLSGHQPNNGMHGLPTDVNQ